MVEGDRTRGRRGSKLLSFDGTDLGWKKARSHLEMASSWVVACRDLVGSFVIKVEEENSLMEVSVDIRTPLLNRSELCGEDETDGIILLDDQICNDITGQPANGIRNSNLSVENVAVGEPRGRFGVVLSGSSQPEPAAVRGGPGSSAQPEHDLFKGARVEVERVLDLSMGTRPGIPGSCACELFYEAHDLRDCSPD